MVFLIVFNVVPFLLIAVFCFKFLILSLLVEIIVVSILDAKVLPFCVTSATRFGRTDCFLPNLVEIMYLCKRKKDF